MALFSLPARRLAAGAITAIVLVGCLFPSLDSLEETAARGAGEPDGSNGKDGGTRRDVGIDDAPVASDDGNTDGSSDGPGPRREIACVPKTCPIPAQYCCTTIGGPDCQTGTEGFCTTVQGGEVFQCDGDEDCDPLQTCCYIAAEETATCRSGCAGGQVLCNGPLHQCPPGKACTGKVASIFSACQ